MFKREMPDVNIQVERFFNRSRDSGFCPVSLEGSKKASPVFNQFKTQKNCSRAHKKKKQAFSVSFFSLFSGKLEKINSELPLTL